MAVKPIPEGYATVTPHLIIRDAKGAIDFYKKAFGAEVVLSLPGPDGKLMHGEIKIGNSMIMVAEENLEWGAKGPKAVGGSPTVIHLYVNDVDALFKRATDAGATTTMPLQDMFWGDRYGKLEDPYGHQWSIATHKEDLTPEQIQEGMKKAMGG